ncbi:hypothetical protein P171DRAFT_480623 [Karstenula rhodostoma CBS 690.94]|uniref:Uncharacterized protein n=1 Tax=Karstenula rhodostoma CBS 690.94 TaxID=1392251 RepID=A0A9P4UHG3_9PLEO|nr:hypothetical protein P171DRAFT_480623 [Karstenula rhodostoma CBS 690.94]
MSLHTEGEHNTPIYTEYSIPEITPSLTYFTSPAMTLNPPNALTVAAVKPPRYPQAYLFLNTSSSAGVLTSIPGLARKIPPRMSQPGCVFGAPSPSPAPSTAVSGSESDVPAMISDGKRMRAIWRPEHGDGEFVQHIVDRSKTTLRGHPTWKLFVDEIMQPIVRGNKQEPPRYVYLDDEACYTVWKSQQYADTELKTYWPFDFDHQGNIKTGRPNRGRPALVDSDMSVIARGKLRGKDKWYAFSGEPGTTDYRPVRPANKTKIELQVEAEWAAQNGQDAGVVSSVEETLDTPTNGTSANMSTTPGSTPITIANGQRPNSPRAARNARLDRVCASRASPPKHAPPKHWEIPERSTSPKNGVKLKNYRSRSVQGSSLDDPPQHIKDSFPTAVSQPNPLSESSTPPPKRKTTGPFLVSSSPPKSSSKSPDHKRAKLAELSPTITGASPKHEPIGPFLISSCPSENSSRSSNHTRVTLAERKASLLAELPPTVASVSPNYKQGGRGEQRSSPLPVEMPEFPLDNDSDREEDEFLAHIGQSLQRKR